MGDHHRHQGRTTVLVFHPQSWSLFSSLSGHRWARYVGYSTIELEPQTTQTPTCRIRWQRRPAFPLTRHEVSSGSGISSIEDWRIILRPTAFNRAGPLSASPGTATLGSMLKRLILQQFKRRLHPGVVQLRASLSLSFTLTVGYILKVLNAFLLQKKKKKKERTPVHRPKTRLQPPATSSSSTCYQPSNPQLPRHSFTSVPAPPFQDNTPLMACLISFSFSTNLFYPKTPFQGTNIRKLASGKFVCPAARRTGKLILSNHASGDILTLNRSCHRDILAPTRRFCEPVMCHFVASSSAHMLISGFWMGPDIEDGWGFVEAFVHRMY
ncbi:hypothetical protein Fot_28812 [Forsythia ovata]|uniref:Uncharacterized protein n=1 Tax=Forsythia ovata TaxID=205694 RepID=A0ABD1TQ28_9LAMI